MNFDDMIEDMIVISRSNLDLIYLWNCTFKTEDPIWFVLVESMRLVNPFHVKKVQCFKFAIPFNGHTTYIVYNMSSSCLMSISPDMAHGLILYPGCNFSTDGLSENIHFLAILPSKTDPLETLSSQFEQSLKSTINLQNSALKHLLLIDKSFYGNIEDVIPIPKLELDLIYLWNCTFETEDPIWSVLIKSEELIESIHAGKIQGCQFSIPINGHTTQIIFNNGSCFPLPNSPDLGHGLIVSLEQDLPSDALLDDMSLLILLPSETDFSNGELSTQSKQNWKCMMNRLCPKLKYLLLKDIYLEFDSVIEDFISISQMKLNLIYFWKCEITTSNPIWSALTASMHLLDLMHTEVISGIQFDITINGHTTQIVCNMCSFFLKPNSPDLLHGLIIQLGQDLPNDLQLDDIFLVFLPSESNPDNSLSSQPKRCLESIRSRCHKLKYLFSKDVSFDDEEGMVRLSWQFGGLKTYAFS